MSGAKEQGPSHFSNERYWYPPGNLFSLTAKTKRQNSRKKKTYYLRYDTYRLVRPHLQGRRSWKRACRLLQNADGFRRYERKPLPNWAFSIVSGASGPNNKHTVAMRGQRDRFWAPETNLRSVEHEAMMPEKNGLLVTRKTHKTFLTVNHFFCAERNFSPCEVNNFIDSWLIHGVAQPVPPITSRVSRIHMLKLWAQYRQQKTGINADSVVPALRTLVNGYILAGVSSTAGPRALQAWSHSLLLKCELHEVTHLLQFSTYYPCLSCLSYIHTRLQYKRI